MAMARTIGLGLLMLSCMSVLSACSSGEAASSEDYQQVDMSQLAPAEQTIKAAAIGDVDKLTELLAGDPALLQVRGPNGNTALHAAAINGQNDAVQFLLDSGAVPGIPNDDGHTAAALAAQYDHLDTAKLIASTIAEGAPAQ